MTDREDIRHKDTQQNPETFASVETAGQKLAAARKENGLSVQEVAGHLNLGVNIIEAVEADDYDNLPGSTFVRGYIRAYANLLRLNPDELIAMLGENSVQMMDIPLASAPSGFSIRFRRKPWGANKKRGFLFKFLVFVVALALMVVALLGLNHWLSLELEQELEKFVSQFLLTRETTEK